MIADVVIVGGGPAGCATALSLRTHAPKLRVVLLEASDYREPRIGEVLAGHGREVLRHLGVWPAFEAERFRPVHRTLAAWGRAGRAENHLIFSAAGAGWHLERNRFDALLAAQATERGVAVERQTRLVHAQRGAAGWQLTASSGKQLEVRFVVDATGRKATFARKQGARPVAFDRLSSFARFFGLENQSEPGTLIEAFAHGWWYSAAAGDRRVVACLTDSDLGRQLRLHELASWRAQLAATSWMRASVGHAQLVGSPITCAAHTVRHLPLGAGDWLAVGDAASAFDPLSAQGLIKSLRAGIFAGYAIGDTLTQTDPRALARYEHFVAGEFASYQRAYLAYYGRERRWPDQPFWQRRQAAAPLARESLGATQSV